MTTPFSIPNSSATLPLAKGSPISGKSIIRDVSLPAAAVMNAPLDHNIRWMQNFAERHGARLAPHGKTTMTPALFRRQIAAGAWGITLATAIQCQAAFAHGISRLLMANQLIGEANMAIVAELIEAGADFYCVVDSHANVSALNAFFSARGLTLNVLVELGVTGGRCGIRNEDELHKLTSAIAGSPALALAGIEGYEGMISGSRAEDDVRAYGKRLVRSVKLLSATSVLAVEKPIVTASGSKWFDLIAQAFDGADLREHYTPILRPGCYVAHDHRLYRQAMADVKTRQPDLEGELEPALVVFAQVQSLPESGLAIVAMGKRDISCDPDLPVPLQRYRSDQSAHSITDFEVRDIMDQHTLMKIPEDSHTKIGDVIAFGASHPCLTFDKWRQILRIDDNLNVQEIMPTCF